LTALLGLIGHIGPRIVRGSGERESLPAATRRVHDPPPNAECLHIRGIVMPSTVSLGLPFVAAYQDTGLGLLGDSTRRAIFELLARRPSSVGELARQLPVSRPAVSQHLRVLREGGLVVSRAEGTRRVYQLDPDGVAALRAWLDGVWTGALTAFQKAAEAAPEEDS
jgi:DNA-binding transcriptional ArsR family regulator